MANIGMEGSGINAWMASVRASMANDPCRQLFEDQVQTHALIFLDDYLEHILTGPKQAPIIELVKTPGRKKNMPRRTRAATAAAARVKNTTLLSLDNDNSATSVVPVNSFHEALLQAKETSVQDAPHAPPLGLYLTSSGSIEKTHDRHKSVQAVDMPQTAVSIEPESQTGMMPPQNPSSESSTHFPASERGTELSVIAEGDESPERSQANVLPSFTITSKSEEFSNPVSLPPRKAVGSPATGGDPKIVPADHQGHRPPDRRQSASSPGNTHHSTPLDSREVPSSEAGASNLTEPLPSRTTVNSPRNPERNAFTAPLPAVPASNLILGPHTISVPLNDLSPRALSHKNGAAGFPTLPAPSPLRKSVRIPQEIPASFVVPTPAPAPVLLGKRTSWLMKAREAKAMEGTGSLPSTSTAATSATLARLSTAVKRKSGEMLGILPLGPDWDKDQRKPKVAKSIEVGIVSLIPKETEETSSHGTPVQGEPPIDVSSVISSMPVDHLESHAMNVDKQITCLNSAEEGFIDLFKRTVEGLGARAAKSMGKSLGGAAVAALAEARAAAEAKVAERNKVGSESGDSEAFRQDDLPDQETLGTQACSDDQPPYVPTSQATGAKCRLSLSDLAPGTVQPSGPELSTKSPQTVDTDARTNSCDESLSTTPPDSPPSKGDLGFVKPAGPVFNKPPPPPVFMPPASKQSTIPSKHPKEPSPNFPPGQFTLSIAVPLGIPARLTSPPNGLLSLVHGTSQASLQPLPSSSPLDIISDSRDGVRPWVSSTQVAVCSIESEPRDVQRASAVDDDDDDSWPLEEKLAAAEIGWRPFDFSNVDKEDTWSSLPTESQGPTGSLTTGKDGNSVTPSRDTDVEVEIIGEEAPQEQEVIEISDAVTEPNELEEFAGAGMTNLRRVESTARSTSQTSRASSTSSSQSQGGFFNQATKLVNSMLGGGKKAKPELKSLQLAAAAAKRQQEEADRKMQRLKDMEARRQVAIAKKAEGERTRLLEEERKHKDESEKRKREREEHTDRRQLKLPVSTKKAEDEASKKRRLAPETEKKLESKKPPSKDTKDLSLLTKSAVTPATKLAAQKGAKATTAALSSSAAYNTTQNAPPAPPAKPFVPEAKPFRVVPSSLKGKAKAKSQEDDIGDKLPSTMVQSQMAARAKAQMQATKLATPEVPSESIELPEINSEYSDSEDEDRVRTFDPPDWAQSPELRQALQMQSTVNPDDIFGAIRPLRMEEMFRTRQSRFRARTSSANWSGQDQLTAEEIREYERRMGFQQIRGS